MKSRKVIITVAPTGNIPTKELNPHTPITPREIVEDVERCYQAGASIAHLHARDGEGRPTTNREVFLEILEGITSSLPVITQVSTGARGGEQEDRGAPLDLNFEMASLSTGSSNFTDRVNANSPELIEYLAGKMHKQGIVPEIEVFDAAMVGNALYYLKKGVLKEPLHFNLVMHVPGSIQGTPKNLLYLRELLPPGATFTVTGIGSSHVAMITMGVLLGGHVRVGLEDVLTVKDREATNELLVLQAVNIIEMLGHQVADPHQAREILF